MRAAFAQLAVVKDHDAVAFLDRRKSVRDDHRSSLLHHAIDRLLDQLFGFGVDRAGRLVKNQDLRVKRQRPGKRDKLLLPDRKTGTAFADLGLVLAVQLLDEFVRPHLSRRPLDSSRA